ncbi:helix-turn-helix domain-containing protein [Sphingomonas sp. RS6]
MNVDLNRSIVFPNRLREQRRQRGFPKLLRLASVVPEIPYIRLSKIERGEVVARADELRRIAAALRIAPADLLIDIDAPGFDIAAWAEPFRDNAAPDIDEARFAVLLAAATRARRMRDPDLTISAVERDYALAPVNLSRVENAQKPFARWNASVQASLFALFGVDNEIALRDAIERQFGAGELDEALDQVTDTSGRLARNSARIADLKAQLAVDAPVPVDGGAAVASGVSPLAPHAVPPGPPRRDLTVHGSPLGQGLIAETASVDTVEAPSNAGPRAFALRVCRATLGAGLPAQAITIVDPDRQPMPGGIAALREETGWRLLSVGADRDGRTIGYSLHPELEVALDECEPSRLAAVIAAVFV